MQVVPHSACPPEALVDLFAHTFSASEGAEEGARIGAFVAALLQTPEADLWGVAGLAGGRPIGAVLFSRMTYPGDPRSVAILSPAAVHPDHQGQGLGQALIQAGLGALKDAGIDVALTYGDPAFYGRLGFAPLSMAQAAAPYPLSFPHGWLGQALAAEAPFAPLTGTPETVPALRDPALW